MIQAAERTRDRLAQAGSEINVAHEMMRITFDIIVETMLSGRGNIDAGRVEQGIRTYLEATSWTIASIFLACPSGCHTRANTDPTTRGTIFGASCSG
jgi:hypothetical protein